MLQFPQFKTHVSRDPGDMGFPWEFDPPAEKVAGIKSAPKARRNLWIQANGWVIYSTVLGAIPSKPVSKDNPPVKLLGLAADYDLPLALDQLKASLEKQLPEEARPTFVEESISGNFRLVWVFEEAFPVQDTAHCGALIRELGRVFKLPALSAGLDPGTYNVSQRYVAGVNWYSFAGATPSKVVQEALYAVGGRRFVEDAGGDYNLDLVAKEVEARWPGRWQGEFELNAKGVRFWDDVADNPNGAMVAREGMVCVTGGKAFVPWPEIFGEDWARKHRQDKLESATGDVFYDGRMFWSHDGNRWVSLTKEDQILDLKCMGLSTRIRKGETASEVDRTVRDIQKRRRVDAALPVAGLPAGKMTIHNSTTVILNTSRVRAMEPAETGDGNAWPWLGQFLEGLFANQQDNPLDHFLAWLKRAYLSLRDGKPLMGQAIFICGPKNNGKTLLSQRVIVPILGGLQRDPYDYLTGKADFNAELFESFVWTLDDADSPRDTDKATVLAKIKDAVVNPNHAYHLKYGAKTSVPWNGRIVSTLNDDSASVGLLPEVNENTRDKLCFFASQEYRGTWGTNEEIESVLEREVPHFARWLLDWEPPAEVRQGGRMGVKSYFDRGILLHSRQQHYAWNFQEILDMWTDSQEADGTVFEPLRATPVKLLSLLNQGPTESVARAWSVPKVHHALRTLAKNPNSGVTELPGDRREYQIEKRAEHE